MLSCIDGVPLLVINGVPCINTNSSNKNLSIGRSIPISLNFFPNFFFCTSIFSDFLKYNISMDAFLSYFLFPYTGSTPLFCRKFIIFFK